MDLRLARQPATDDAMLGKLFIDGVFCVFTLESAEDAIPLGRYPVTITPSTRFGRLLPLIEHVPGREGIRIHPGNWAKDTEGCILVGMAQTPQSVLDSKLAQATVQASIAHALALGQPVWLTVEHAADLKTA